MITLSIPEMNCGHCKASVEGAVQGLDPAAKVTVDLQAHTAKIETSADAAALIAALDEVGFVAQVAA